MTAKEFIGDRVTIDGVRIRCRDGEQLVKFDGFLKLSLAVPGEGRYIGEGVELRGSIMSFIADAINDKIERETVKFKIGDQVITGNFDDLKTEEWSGILDKYTPFLDKIGCVTDIEQGYATVYYTVHGSVWPTCAIKKFEQ